MAIINILVKIQIMYRNCVYCSYIVRFYTDKIDIGFYHVLSDLFTLDCTAHNTHNYVILFKF